MAKLRNIKRSKSYQLKRDTAAKNIKKQRGTPWGLKLATGKEGKNESPWAVVQ